MKIKIEQANIKDLNKQAPMLMRALHNTFHYDFNQPYGFYHIDGRFTIKQLEPYVLNNADTIILIRVKPNEHIYDIWQSNCLNVVRYNPHENGGYQIGNCRAVGAWGSDSFDYFIRKGDFDTMRKSDLTDAWLLTQERANMHYSRNCNNIKFDPTDRFKVTVPKSEGKLTQDTFVRYCSFIPYGYNGKSSDTYDFDYYDTTISEYIDKSGYIIRNKRAELMRKVRALKAQKAKEEYLKTDNSDKITTLERLIDRYKAKLSEQLLAIADYDECYDIEQQVGWRGLRSVYEDFDEFKKNTEKKLFNSIAESDALYDRINKRIYEYL